MNMVDALPIVRIIRRCGCVPIAIDTQADEEVTLDELNAALVACCDACYEAATA